jgi:hypothetical protein
MNNVLASLPMCLIAILGVLVARPSFAVSVLGVRQFVDLCAPAKSTDFKPEEELFVGHSPIHVFLLTADRYKTLAPYVAVYLKRGTDQDAEIPLFDKICVSDATMVPTLKNNGDITFKGYTRSAVTMVFRRADQNLKHSHWKTDPNDLTSANPSVWLVSYTPSTGSTPPPPPEPTPNDWCDINTPKKVGISGDDVYFTMCPYNAALAYRYALHLEQKGKDYIPVDIGIDPQIVHQP